MRRHVASAPALLLLAGLIVATSVEARKPKASPTPVPEPLTSGDASGPYAVALGRDGFAHLAYSRGSEDGESEIVYRAEGGMHRWQPPETVLRGEVEAIALAATPSGPVVGFVRDGAGYLAFRGERGWWAVVAVGGGDERAITVALASDGITTRGYFTGQRGKGGGALFLRRVPADPEGAMPRSSPVLDAPLDAEHGEVLALAVSAESATGDLVAFCRRLPQSRVRIYGGESETDTAPRAMSYARFDTRLGRPVRILTPGNPDRFAMAAPAGGPFIVWSGRRLGNSQVVAQRIGWGQLGIEPLLEDEHPVRSLAAATGSTLTFVAAVYGASPRPIRGRWYDGNVWSAWALPPGFVAGTSGEAMAVAAVLGEGRIARTFVQMRDSVAADAPQRITEWVFVPSGM